MHVYGYVIISFFYVSELLKAAESCTEHPRPKSIDLKYVYDVKDRIGESVGDMHDHTAPKNFKFVKLDGKASMFYRAWSHDPWMGPVVVLKVRDWNCAIITVLITKILKANGF
jgi:hypothetical protein